MDIKKCLVQGYGNSYGNTYDVLTSDKIKTKIEICEELLELNAKFYPGKDNLHKMSYWKPR